MQNSERPEFIDILISLEAYFEKELSKPLREIYWKGLQDLSLENYRAAAEKAMTELKFFPKIADLRGFVTVGGDDAAASAWTQLDRAIAHGPGPSLYLQDGTAGAALKAVFGSWPAACEQLHPVFGPAPVSWEEREAARLERRNPDDGPMRQIGGLTPEMRASKRKEFIVAYRNAQKTGQKVHYFTGQDVSGLRSGDLGWKDRYLTAQVEFQTDLVHVSGDEIRTIKLAYDLHYDRIESDAMAALEAGTFALPPKPEPRMLPPEKPTLQIASKPLSEEENRALREKFREETKAFARKLSMNIPPTMSDVELEARKQRIREQAAAIEPVHSVAPTVEEFPE